MLRLSQAAKGGDFILNGGRKPKLLLHVEMPGKLFS
jgi:hypothetical protein